MPQGLQAIPAQRGTATFVPRGHTIKIVNTYGKQIIEAWAFALPQPPEEDPKHEVEKDEKSEEKADDKVDSGTEEQDVKPVDETRKNNEAPAEASKSPNLSAEEKKDDTKAKDDQAGNQNAPDPEIQAPDEPDEGNKSLENSATSSKGWSSYIPSIRRSKLDSPTGNESNEKQESEEAANTSPTSTQKKPWSSYLSYPQRKDGSSESEDNSDSAGNKRGWSSYLPQYHPRSSANNTNSKQKTWANYMPSGKGFSSYLPSREAVSTFTAAHKRDPSKSYAEQLYDFSKTPVGAGAISYATGSGYSATLYSAYKAYSPPTETPPPTEYLSLSHTREATARLSPQKGDTLVTNLRRPLLTLLEDTSPGDHATLLPACDPARFASTEDQQEQQAGGSSGWEERGSCAENLVFALRALNDSVGLHGASAIGADISVQIAPAPLCLFLRERVNGATVDRAEPDKRGVFVRFQALRDCVVVMSDCPQRGDASKVAHFVVQEGRIEGEEDDGAIRAIQRGREANEKAEAERLQKIGEKDVDMGRKVAPRPNLPKTQAEGQVKNEPNVSKNPAKQNPARTERKKPRKLERRNTGSQK
jgi:uncharacterized protein YcgI (DUF1989 family)